VHVVVLLLLVAGLALLVLGLITGSTPLVVGSIAASLLAAMAIVRYRRGRQAGVGASSEPAVAPSANARAEQSRDGTATPVRTPARAAVTAEPIEATVPPAHAAESIDVGEPAPAEQADATAEAGPGRGEGQVEPEYSAEQHPAETRVGPVEPEYSAEADADPAEAHTDPPLRSRGDEPVWVIDGRPRYHLPGCAFLLGRGPVPVPLRQAVEDGFTPCGLCDPDSGLAAPREPLDDAGPPS
jgi:hypothetical protein